MDIKTFSDSKWNKIIRFLGLEQSQEIFEAIGLHLQDKNLFFKKLNNQHIGETYFVPWDYEKNGKKVLLDQRNFLENIEDYRLLTKWLECTYIVFASDEPEWFLWKRLFRDVYDDLSKNSSRTYFSVNSVSSQFIEGYKKMKDNITNSVMKIKKVDNKQLSDWDLNFYSIFEMMSLFDLYFIEWTVENFYFKNYFYDFVHPLSNTEKDYMYTRIILFHKAYIEKTETFSLPHPNQMLTKIC